MASTQQGAAADKQTVAVDPKTPSPNTVLLPPDESSRGAAVSAGRTRERGGGGGGAGRAGGTKRAAAAAAGMDAEAGQQQGSHGGGVGHKHPRVDATPFSTMTGSSTMQMPDFWAGSQISEENIELRMEMLRNLSSHVPWAHQGPHPGMAATFPHPALNPNPFPHPPQYSNPGYLPLLQQYQVHYSNLATAIGASPSAMGYTVPLVDPTTPHAVMLAAALRDADGASGASGGGIGAEGAP